MVFSRANYLLLLLGLLIIVIGYVVMRMENEVDGFISLYIAPILILGGYLEIMYAIFYHSRPLWFIPEPASSKAPQQARVVEPSIRS